MWTHPPTGCLSVRDFVIVGSPPRLSWATPSHTPSSFVAIATSSPRASRLSLHIKKTKSLLLHTLTTPKKSQIEAVSSWPTAVVGMVHGRFLHLIELTYSTFMWHRYFCNDQLIKGPCQIKFEIRLSAQHECMKPFVVKTIIWYRSERQTYSIVASKRHSHGLYSLAYIDKLHVKDVCPYDR